MNIVNENLKCVSDWCDANRLTINANKTNFVIIKSKRKMTKCQGVLKIKNKIIDEVENARFVGVIVDQNLSWHQHINEVKEKISKITGVFYRLRHFVPQYVLVMLYNAFVLPHLMYGLEVWGNTFPTYIQDILQIQKKLVRIITFSDWNAPSAPLFRKLGILDIFNLHKLQLGIFVHDALHARLPHIFDYFFTYVNHSYRTRQNVRNELSIPKIRHKAGDFTVKYAGTKI